MNTILEVKVIDKTDLRLDKFLAGLLNDLSRTRVQALIKQGYVQVNGQAVCDPSFKVKQDDLVRAELVPAESSEVKPKESKLDIVYEDEYLAVLNKPAGLTVHPGAGNHNDTLVNSLLAHYKEKLSSVAGQTRAGIVHRLDRNTSGLLIIAKDNRTHLELTKMLSNKLINRIYNAIIWGTTDKMSGTIEANIGRSARDRKKMGVQAVGGKTAVTHYKTLAIFQKRAVSLLECELETGRTHQIRVHLSHIGHPIVGDPEYGSNKTKRVQQLSEAVALHIRTISRQMLHAKRIVFSHPITNKLIDLEIDLPEDMREFITLLSQ
jgi:23S rRNA pseudouridine1911/1915/1917 synthase